MHTIFPSTEARLAKWKAQPGVLGVILVGSKSQGHADASSDDDLEVLLTDEAARKLKPTECSELLIEGEGKERRLIYDALYVALSALEHNIASPLDIDHWPYERAQILFDRDGRVTSTVATLGHMDEDFRRRRLLHASIDGWVAAGRGLKTLLRGYDAASRLLVARGVKALERLLFALEWRWVPMDHWLEKELPTLEDPTQTGPLLLEALKTGDPMIVSQALKQLEDRLFAEGVPREAERLNLFLELIHAKNARERAIHGLF